MKQVKLIRTTQELRAWRRSVDATVGLVPTMGALHAGHAELLRRLRPRCEILVLSIFVNPTQFGLNEDLSKYPRTFERDRELAQSQGVDVIFAPDPAQIYPQGFSTYVEETKLSQPLCGSFRPGHFRGVATIVLKLFNLVRPEIALFGLKDAQQFFVLHRMARDLDLDVSVEAMPTVREDDGLALSSRNVYLSTEERAKAPELYRALTVAAEQLRRTPERVSEILSQTQDALSCHGFKVQYLEFLSLPDLVVPPIVSLDQPYLLAAAAYLGKTRLIDNVILNSGRLGEYGVVLEG